MRRRIFLLVLLLQLGLPALSAPMNYNQKVQELLEMGYALEHSTVDGLIRTIKNEDFENINKFDAYGNLQSFFPDSNFEFEDSFEFSFRWGHHVLDLIEHLSKTGKLTSDLIEFTSIFKDIRIAPTDFVDRMLEVAVALPQGYAKLDILKTLLRFQSHQEPALDALKTMADQLEDGEKLKISLSFELLKVGLQVEMSEAIIATSMALDALTFDTVLSQSLAIDAPILSEAMLQQMQSELEKLPKRQSKALTRRFNLIREKHGLPPLNIAPLSCEELIDLSTFDPTL